jgi:hypothetical protein
MDASSIFAVLLGTVLLGALAGVLPHWRAVVGSRADLPIRRFLSEPTFEAEVRCAMCAHRKACAKRSSPHPDCPNARLLSPGA